MIYIIWTCKNLEEAKVICKEMLNRHLIACASLQPSVISLYHWKGEIHESIECKVFLKTIDRLFDPICQYITREGSYEVPEITKILVTDASPAYLEWIETFCCSQS